MRPWRPKSEVLETTMQYQTRPVIPDRDGYASPELLISPVNRTVFAYWQRVRGARSMPARADIDPADLVAVLPHLILLDVQREPLDFRYRLIGSLVADYSAEHTGKWMSSIPHQAPPSRIWSACQTVVETGEPMSTDVPNVGKLRDFKRIEDIMMPLSEDGRTINMLFVAVDFL